MAEHAQQQQQQPEPASDRFFHRAVVASLVFVALVFLALFLWYSIYVLFLIFAGVLVAIMLRALADVVRHFTGLSHRWSLVIVLIVLVGLLTAFWFFAAPSLARQGAALAEKLPEAWQTFQEKFRGTAIGRLFSQAPDAAGAASQPTSQPAPQGGLLSGSTGGGVGALLGRFSGFLTTVMDLIGALLVVVFTGLYLAFDPTLYVRGAIRLVPPPYRIRFGEVIGALGYTLKWWLIGQGITMLIVTVTTWIGLAALGVPLAFVLAVIAGLFNFIPNFGPLFAMVPATLLALTIGPERALGVIALFLVIQTVEGNILTPLIQSTAVDLPPALGIIAQILLGILVGSVGLVLAWPLAAVIVLLVKMLYVEDALGDEVPTPDDHAHKEVRQAKAEARKVKRDEKKD